MGKMQTNRARGELLSIVLVTGCVYISATALCMYAKKREFILHTIKTPVIEVEKESCEGIFCTTRNILDGANIGKHI